VTAAFRPAPLEPVALAATVPVEDDSVAVRSSTVDGMVPSTNEAPHSLLTEENDEAEAGVERVSLET
jgi:hypothetical protein